MPVLVLVLVPVLVLVLVPVPVLVLVLVPVLVLVLVLVLTLVHLPRSPLITRTPLRRRRSPTGSAKASPHNKVIMCVISFLMQYELRPDLGSG